MIFACHSPQRREHLQDPLLEPDPQLAQGFREGGDRDVAVACPQRYLLSLLEENATQMPAMSWRLTVVVDLAEQVLDRHALRVQRLLDIFDDRPLRAFEPIWDSPVAMVLAELPYLESVLPVVVLLLLLLRPTQKSKA